jgi:polyhydroxybutyrate depolymerase
VVVLHGYSATGSLEDLYLGVSATATDFGYLTLTPDGTTDPGGNRFWNAGGFAGAADDVAYLTALIDEVVDDYGADPDRVFLIGHSNGGFMAHRMACEVPERIAAIATLAGGILGTGEECRRPVRAIVIHGTADTTVPYEGGEVFGTPLLGAVATTERWRTANECSPADRQEGPFDFDLAVPGTETSVTVWDGCTSGATVELWTMAGSGHIPAVFLEFRGTLVERLLAAGRVS